MPMECDHLWLNWLSRHKCRYYIFKVFCIDPALWRIRSSEAKNELAHHVFLEFHFCVSCRARVRGWILISVISKKGDNGNCKTCGPRVNLVG